MITDMTGPWRIRRGLHYESVALSYLRSHGLQLIERNYRCPLGEIDLIMRDGLILVFVEVRFRADTRYGAAHETVDRRKQQKLLRSAQHYLLLHNKQYANCSCRFDVLGVSKQLQQMQINWLKDAFQ